MASGRGEVSGACSLLSAGHQREAVPGPAGAALPCCHLPLPPPQRPGARGPSPGVPRQGGALAGGGRRPGGLQVASAAGREGLRCCCCVTYLFLNKYPGIIETGWVFLLVFSVSFKWPVWCDKAITGNPSLSVSSYRTHPFDLNVWYDRQPPRNERKAVCSGKTRQPSLLNCLSEELQGLLVPPSKSVGRRISL